MKYLAMPLSMMLILATTTGRGDLSARWPRHILDAVKEQNKQQGDDKGYISLASTPVSPSMSSVPQESDAKTSELDLKAKSTSVEKEGVDAESPMTAMDLAKSPKEPVAHSIRGVSVPSKPSPPGPEGTPSNVYLVDSVLTLVCI